MELSTFATVIGMIELLFGIPLLAFPKEASRWIMKLMKDEVDVRLIGGFLFLLGGLVIYENPSIGFDIEGVLRLLAWAVAIKGIFYAWHPEWITSMKIHWLKDHNLALLFGVITVAFGILFIAAGSVV